MLFFVKDLYVKQMARKFFIIISLSFFWQFSGAQVSERKMIPVMNFDQLQPYLHLKNDTVYLVNFWATWCGPCRKGMPAIQSVAGKYAAEPFKVLLVSLDMADRLETSLIPFIKDKNIDLEVILLDDPDQNRWIDLVDKSWSGEIPFTLIYRRDFRETYPREFTFEELDSIINLILNLQ